jgi:hypothetical protein
MCPPGLHFDTLGRLTYTQDPLLVHIGDPSANTTLPDAYNVKTKPQVVTQLS